MEVRRLKGDARMGELLRRALAGRRRPLDEDASLRVRFARATLSAERVNELVASIVARPAPYKAGRLRPARPARQRGPARLPFIGPPGRRRSLVRTGAHVVRRVRGPARHALADGLPHRAGPRPALAPGPSWSDSPPGLFSDVEWPLLLRDPGGHRVSATAWSADDLALLDEATFLTGGRTRTYGHIVVDEAQDLTPMQFRMVARRAPSGSITVLGDLAQATGPWTYSDWEEVRAHLPRRSPGPPRRAHARLPGAGPGARLRLAAPARGCAGRHDRRPPSGPVAPIPSCARWKPGELARRRAGRGPCAGSGPRHWWRVIVPDELAPAVARWPGATTEVGTARSRRHDPARHDRPGPGSQGPRVRRRRRRRALGHRRRGSPWSATALCRHDPSHPAPEHRARPSRCPSRSWAEPQRLALPSRPWLWTWTARSLSSRAGATGSARVWPGIWRARGAHVVIADTDVARGQAVADELGGRFVRTDVADPAASTRGGRMRGRGLRRAPHRAPERRRHLVVRHGRRLRSRGLPALHGHQPRRRRLRHRRRPARHQGERWRDDRGDRLHGRVWSPRPSIRSTRPTSMPSSAWRARWARSTNRTASASMRCARPSRTRTSSRAPSRRCSTWDSPSSRWPMSSPPSSASSTPTATGQCWYVVAGSQSEPFEFRRAPGPRLD